MNYQAIHNASVGVAFIGTVLLVLEVLQEMQALQFTIPDDLDIPGFLLVVVGSVLATWTARKMDKSNNKK